MHAAKKLVIKSHSDELSKKVIEYFQKYPHSTAGHRSDNFKKIPDRLAIKSHSEDLQKKLKHYFEKYPELPDYPSEVSQIEKELQEEINYLKRVLNK